MTANLSYNKNLLDTTQTLDPVVTVQKPKHELPTPQAAGWFEVSPFDGMPGGGCIAASRGFSNNPSCEVALTHLDCQADPCHGGAFKIQVDEQEQRAHEV